MSINDQVKRIVRNYIESAQLADAVHGAVTSIDPLEVTVEQRFALSADFLVVPEHLTALRIAIEGREYEIRRGLEPGDRVVMIRSSGAGRYLIAGRVSS